MRFITDIPAPIYVDRPELVERAVRHCQASSMLGTDTETLGKWRDDEKKPHHNMNDQIIVMGLSPDEGTRYLVPRVWLDAFRPVLENVHVPKATHNFKFDQHRFANAGHALRGPIADGLVLDWLLDEDTRENKHDLKSCGRDFLGIPMVDYKDLFGNEDPNKISRPGHPLFEKYLDYSTLDPWASRKLCLHHLGKLADIPVWSDSDWSLWNVYWDTEEPQLHCLWNMERRGIKIDAQHLTRVASSLEGDMHALAAELASLVGYPVNPNSVPQVQKLFFEQLGLPVLKRNKETNNVMVDEEVLSHFANQMQVRAAQLILDYRGASKLKGTYAQGMLKRMWKDGRIHTTYNPTKVTGRLSSSDPNLQNLPQPDWDLHAIRAAFIPDSEDDCLIAADYSQLEMRVLACASGDPGMIRALCDGLDMHTFAASQALGISYAEAEARKKAKLAEFISMRTGMKRVGFGIVYGARAKKIADQLSAELKRAVSEAEAQDYIDRYMTTFPGVQSYMDTYIASAKINGYVQTLAGRFRRLSRINSRRFGERSEAERQAINTPIQGSAADIVKRAMLACEWDAYLASLGWTLRLQIHDELVFNGPKATAAEASGIIKQYMEHPFNTDLAVPLTVDPAIVKNWKEAK